MVSLFSGRSHTGATIRLRARPDLSEFDQSAIDTFDEPFNIHAA
jgi:hypothetical protein